MLIFIFVCPSSRASGGLTKAHADLQIQWRLCPSILKCSQRPWNLLSDEAKRTSSGGRNTMRSTLPSAPTTPTGNLRDASTNKQVQIDVVVIFDRFWSSKCSVLESRNRAVVGNYRKKCCQRCCDSQCTILYGARRLGGHWKWRSHRANQAPRAENSRQDERWKIPWRTRRKEILCDDGTGLSIINLLQGWHEQISCEFRFLHKPDILWSAGVEPWPGGTFQHTRSDDALICFELTLKSFQRSNQHRPG